MLASRTRRIAVGLALALGSGCGRTEALVDRACAQGETRACYSGPAATRGVGACRDGAQRCLSDGTGFGGCAGDLLPAEAEGRCDDGLDADCDGLVDCADADCAMALACCTPDPHLMTLWAHSFQALYRVDPETFTVTLVGRFDVPDSMTDLAVTPDGTIYVVSYDTLYRVHPTSGEATPVAALLGSSNNGLTFLPDGTLLASDLSGVVKRIDPGTGAVTVLGSFGGGLSSSGDLVAVEGVMYGVSSTNEDGSDASTDNLLLRVDTETGAATPVGPIGFGSVWGLAYVSGRVIAFTNLGEIIEVDPRTGRGTLLATKDVPFWGAGMSPLTPANPCP